MARILITGSADGLGQMAAQRLVDTGHDVVLHARNRQRAQQAVAAVPKARSVLVGDLASIAEIRAIAEQAHAAGAFDAVIHNAGVGYREPRTETVDGLEHVFAINVLAPYLLTALIRAPRRLSGQLYWGRAYRSSNPRSAGCLANTASINNNKYSGHARGPRGLSYFGH